MTSGKTSIQLEWAITVCIRLQFMMVVGMAFSLFPLISISSNSSSLAILLWKQEFENFFLLIDTHILFWSGGKSSGFHYFKKIKLQTLVLVHSSACHLSSHQTLTQFWNKMCAASVNVLLTLLLKWLILLTFPLLTSSLPLFFLLPSPFFQP